MDSPQYEFLSLNYRLILIYNNYGDYGLMSLDNNIFASSSLYLFYAVEGNHTNVVTFDR